MSATYLKLSPRRYVDRRVSAYIRYRIMRDDRFRCVLCGNSPTLDPNCTLTVEYAISLPPPTPRAAIIARP